MSKCPPGVICFENFTFIYVIIALFVIIYFMYIKQSDSIVSTNNNSTRNMSMNAHTYQNMPSISNPFFGVFPKPRPSHSFTNTQNDVLLNPYTPPLKDDRIIVTNDYGGDVRGRIPININTRAVDTNYRQVGLLKRMNGPEMLLPLMGTPTLCRER